MLDPDAATTRRENAMARTDAHSVPLEWLWLPMVKNHKRMLAKQENRRIRHDKRYIAVWESYPLPRKVSARSYCE